MSADTTPHTSHAVDDTSFERTMKARHLIMLSLGGVIGTGLFFNTGFVIGEVGALGTVLAYLVGATLVYFVMLSLGELCVAMPHTGSFHLYTSKYISPRVGFTVAWLYWLTCTVCVGTSLLGAGLSMQYWFPDTPVWFWCLVFCVLVLGMNVFTSRLFAEGEFVFSLIKVVTIQVFIILGGLAVFGVIPLADGSPAPYFKNLTEAGPFPNGILPMVTTMVAVFFAFSGTELIGVAAGETENPQRVIPMAIRTTVVRLVVFFIGTIVILAALLPPEEATILKSPFVTIFERLGIPYAASIFNFVILTAVVSAANANLFASGRMLWSLSKDGMLPKALAKQSKNGLPVTALVVSMLGGWATLVTSVVAADTVFVFLTALCGFSVVVVWMSISLAHINFRKRWLEEGRSLDELPYRAPWFPFVPIAAIVLCCIACVGLAFDPEQRLALIVGLPFFIGCLLVYPKLAARRPQHGEPCNTDNC